MPTEPVDARRVRHLPDECRNGPVTLAVKDRDGLVVWYGKVLGFVEQARGADRSVLGAPGGEPLLVLHSTPDRKAHDPRHAGLLHIAYLLPSRIELGRWVRHIAEEGVALEGASDHLVSEAFYLTDPEGNGIEVYCDRPRSEWPRKDALIAMATLPADVEGILREGHAAHPFDHAPAGTQVGHVHLKVADLQASRAFYVDALGLDIMAHYPGALFVAAGGYHHHLGLNIWRSQGRAKPSEPELGLEEVTLVLSDEAEIAATLIRLQQYGFKIDVPTATAFDPAGNVLRFRVSVPEAFNLAA
jgi:catechol 2,3-dioxygenase